MPRQPMQSTPLELTRRSFEAADSGDFDAMIGFYGPDSVFDMAPWGLGTHAGLVAIRAFFEDWIGAFDEFAMKLEEAEELGDGLVFAVALQNALPAGGRSHLQLRHAAIAEWSNGVALRVTNYPDIDRARTIANQLALTREQEHAAR
jgi:ketosteroid isomerase-like protein